MPPALPAESLLEHAEFVQRLAVRLAGPGSDAEDLGQETLVRGLRRPPPRDGNLRGWLRAVTTNAWRNARRTRHRQRALALAHRPIAEHAPAVDDIAAREETRRRVVAAVLQLPDPLRQVVLLYFYEGLDSPAIGRRIGRAPSTVRTQLQAALARLRVRLDDEHGGDRAAWAVPLLAWRGHRTAAAVSAAATAWRSAVAALALVAAGAVVWWVWPAGAAPVDRPASTGTAEGAPARTGAPGGPAFERADRSRLAAAERAAPRPHEGAPPLGALRVLVRDDETSRPIADARVSLRAVPANGSVLAGLEGVPDLALEARSDAAGECAFASLPAGAYDVDVAAPDDRSARQWVSVGETERRITLDLRARPYVGVVAVKVVDRAGYPVADAEVTLAAHCTLRGMIGTAQSPPIAGRTDHRGLFLLRDPARVEHVYEGLVVARCADGRAGTRSIGRPEHRGSNPWFEVTVDEPGAIAGRLLGPAAARAGARVTAMPVWTYDNVRPECVVGSHPLRVGADGTFAIDALPTGRYHLLVDAAPGFGDARLAGVTSWQFLPATKVAAGERAAVDIELRPLVRVRGRVTDEAGTPFRGARLTAIAVDGDYAGVLWHPSGDEPPSPATRLRAHTDATGAYELWLAPGAWHLGATAPGRELDVRSVEVAAEAAEIALEHRLYADGSLRGRVPFDVLWLRPRSTGAASPIIQAVETRDGAIALRGLRAGTWELGCEGGDGFTRVTSVEIEAGRTTWVDLTASARGEVRGTLLHDGAPLAGIEVDAGDGGRAAITGPDGAFAVPLAADRVEEPAVRFAHRGLPLGSRRVAGPGEAGIVELGLRRLDLTFVPPAGGAPGVAIRLSPLSGTGDRIARAFLPDGRLRDQWLRRDHAYFLDARFADGARIERQVPAGDEPLALTIGGTRTAGLTVRLLDAAGAPRIGGQLSAVGWGRESPPPADGASFWAGRDPKPERGGRWPFFASSDADGVARFVGLPPGPVLVWFSGGWGEFGYESRRAVLPQQPPPAERIVVLRPGRTDRIELALAR